MNFQIIEYKSVDKQYKEYDGRFAITLGWSLSFDQPRNERYIIILPRSVDNPYLIGATSDDCNGNNIRFHNEFGNIWIETEGMTKFTEYKEIKPPSARVNKYGERPVYRWSSYAAKWMVDGYEQVEEQ